MSSRVRTEIKLLALLAYVPIRSWGGIKLITSSNVQIIRSNESLYRRKSGGSIYYKPIQCPTGYIMTGTRM
ncbi:fragment of pilV protein, Shufflon protein (C-ter part) [Escherichia coli]|uniref:Fragment of pilV protein, Shufflon protein (C-ter part) n=1 Tax=Escherichia coli TaxID=562 RepID=A0A377EAH3_ECOLX|nr:fragment of pilV protein, Shufflon protein (C-ter part) [Escherichia coli]